MAKALHPKGWGDPVMGRKHCSCCTRWRLLIDFCVKERNPATGEPARLDHMCRACGRAYRRERYRKNPERFLPEQREWHRLQRRLRGQQQRYPDGRGYKGHVVLEPYRGMTGHQGLVPEAPLRAWLEVVVAREVHDDDHDHKVLANLLGIAERQLFGIRRGEYSMRAWGLADKMLTRYGVPVEVPGYGTVWRIEDLWPVELGEQTAVAA